MVKFCSAEFLSELTDQEVSSLDTYVDKCAEEGVMPTHVGFIQESEKFAEIVDGAFALGQQLAETSFALASQAANHSDVPEALIKKASGRYEDAGFALDLASMATAAMDVVLSYQERSNE
jgi:hypothetical protein